MERPDLSIAVQRSDAEAVLTLAGEIDMSTAGELATTVGELLAGGRVPPRILLDLADVTFCDSQGLGTLVVLSRKAAMTHSCLVLVNVGDFLLRVLDITGLRVALMIQQGAA